MRLSKKVAIVTGGSRGIGFATAKILSENGATPIAKLLRELSEEEKIIQRSIGWLAQEGKINLDTTSRGETIALKD